MVNERILGNGIAKFTKYETLSLVVKIAYLRVTPRIPKSSLYEGWHFNSGNYLFTTDTK